MPEPTSRQRFWKQADEVSGETSQIKEDWHGHQGQALPCKHAEIIGSWEMPQSRVPSKHNPGERPKKLGVTRKVASDLLSAFGWEQEKVANAVKTESEYANIDAELEKEFGVKPEQPPALPQNKNVLTPHVNVTKKDPPTLVKEKTASSWAMPSICRYPLDTFEQVKAASAYFDEYWKRMAPEDRREFAHNLVKRAEALGEPIGEEAKHYGASGYGTDAQLRANIDIRLELNKIAGAEDLYEQLYTNRRQMPAEVYARTLHEIDKYAGLDWDYDAEVSDPFYSTFGLNKTAADEEKDSVVIGNEYMKTSDLITFARSKPDMIKGLFGDEFRKELQADPTGIFDSLPRDQKLIIMRMVNNSRSQVEGASAS